MSATIHAKSGSVRVPIFRSSGIVRGKRYVSHVIRWTDLHGQRHSKRIAKLSAAKAEAQRIADDLAAARPQCVLAAAEIATYNAVTHALRFCPKPLPNIASEAAEAIDLVPDVPLPELARFYRAHQPKSALHLTTAVAVETYLATRKKKGISARWQATLGSQLRRFATDLPGPIAAITAEMIDTWVLGLPDVGAKTRNNYLAAVQALYSLPALAHAPHRAAIQALDPCGDTAPKDNVLRRSEIWTPAEMRQLLDAALLPYAVANRRTGTNDLRSHLHLVPMLVLGGFCKMRNESEAMRARWENVHLRDRQIYANGKTGERLVTLTPNAVEWLKTCQQPAGKIWPWAESKLHRDLRALAKRCGLEWRANGLRKSASTYAFKLSPDAEEISGEAGNSAAVLRKFYLRSAGITKQQARDWFAIRPPKQSRVIVPMGAVHSKAG